MEITKIGSENIAAKSHVKLAENNLHKLLTILKSVF